MQRKQLPGSAERTMLQNGCCVQDLNWALKLQSQHTTEGPSIWRCLLQEAQDKQTNKRKKTQCLLGPQHNLWNQHGEGHKDQQNRKNDLSWNRKTGVREYQTSFATVQQRRKAGTWMPAPTWEERTQVGNIQHKGISQRGLSLSSWLLLIPRSVSTKVTYFHGYRLMGREGTGVCCQFSSPEKWMLTHRQKD